MRKSQSKLAERTPQPAAAVGRDENQDKKRQRRESIESFVVVFLAFLVWSFEAEGFVIPTGFDGADAYGPAQGDRLPRVRLHLHGQRGLRGRFERLGGVHRACGSRGARARIAVSRPGSTMRPASRATASTR